MEDTEDVKRSGLYILKSYTKFPAGAGIWMMAWYFCLSVTQFDDLH